MRKRESELLSVAEEALTSIRVVKAFAREDYEEERFGSESLANVEAGLRARSVKAKLAPWFKSSSPPAHCSVLGYGAALWSLARPLTVGWLIMFLMC